MLKQNLIFNGYFNGADIAETFLLKNNKRFEKNWALINRQIKEKINKNCTFNLETELETP